MSFVWLRAYHYAGNGLARLLNMFSFSIMLLVPGALREAPRPDIIIGSSVHPLAAWSASRLAIKYQVPFVFEPRDLWPDSLVALGKMTPKGILTRILYKLERTLFARAELVISPLPGVDRYMARVGFKDKRFTWISNGIEAQAELPSVDKEVTGNFNFGYLGSMGNANALDTLILAFDDFYSSVQDDHCYLHLVGDGPDKARLMKLAKSLKTENQIIFHDPVPKNEVLNVANGFDCLVANMRDLRVYQYGISLNKIFDYLLAARPIIFACSALNNPVLEADAGLGVPADDRALIAQAMLSMHELSPAERLQFGRNGRAHALAHYSYSQLAAHLADELDWLVEAPAGRGSNSERLA